MKHDGEHLLFKTNIRCSECIASVKPHLDAAKGIWYWEVDINNKNNVLSVKSAGITEEEVMEAVKHAGFRIEVLL